MKNFFKLAPIAAAMVFGMTGVANAVSGVASATGWGGGLGPDFGLTFSGGLITETGATDFSDNFLFEMPHLSAHLVGGANVLSGEISTSLVMIDHFELWNHTTSTLISSASSLPDDIARLHIPAAIYSLTDTYRLHIDGHLTSAHLGSYAGQMNVTHLPEPETYAMFMAGLGLMGFIARRRKNGQS
jgi:hypothetical protein